jgi:hypothetical protein
LIVIEAGAHGGAEALRVVERSLPPVRADEVLVRNRWIGVNWVDPQHVAGTPYPTAVPFVPGTEAAGEVMAVGSRVRDLAAGAPVVHFGHMGGVYAEYTAVPAGHVVPLDDPGLVRDAAALAINGTTAHVLLRDAAGVRPGQVVVVQAVLYGQSGGPVSPVDPAVLSEQLPPEGFARAAVGQRRRRLPRRPRGSAFGHAAGAGCGLRRAAGRQTFVGVLPLTAGGL